MLWPLRPCSVSFCAASLVSSSVFLCFAYSVPTTLTSAILQTYQACSHLRAFAFADLATQIALPPDIYVASASFFSDIQFKSPFSVAILCWISVLSSNILYTFPFYFFLLSSCCNVTFYSFIKFLICDHLFSATTFGPHWNLKISDIISFHFRTFSSCAFFFFWSF